MTPEARPGGPTKERLRLPEGNESTVEVIGSGAAAAPAVVELLTAARGDRAMILVLVEHAEAGRSGCRSRR